MDYLPAVLALLAAAAGWHYLFYSRAAEKLSSVEALETNRLRVRLRRICGGVMILMAVAFYAGYVAFAKKRIAEAAWLMLLMMLLMGAMVLLGLVDLRLTRKLRKRGREAPSPPDGDDPKEGK